MPRQFQPADPDLRQQALDAWRAGSATRDDLKLLVKDALARLQAVAPGHSVEVRVPPYAAAQAIAGVRHTRGTPPAVIETDADTWIAVSVGDLPWAEAIESGRVRASGERTDLASYLPL